MTIEQTVGIPVSHRLTIDVPFEIPAGPVVLTFTPKTAAQNQKKGRKFGCAKGQFKMADDFDGSTQYNVPLIW